jgi:hypothetical protein
MFEENRNVRRKQKCLGKTEMFGKAEMFEENRNVRRKQKC